MELLLKTARIGGHLTDAANSKEAERLLPNAAELIYANAGSAAFGDEVEFPTALFSTPLLFARAMK